MRIVIKSLWVSCALYILLMEYRADVTAFKNLRTTAEESGAHLRSSRAVNRPEPVNCHLGRWSAWTPCNSCTSVKFRSRDLGTPSKFGGSNCLEISEEAACPVATTECLVLDYCGEQFTCNETGRCISQSLRCNGERDCESFSDEEGCQEINRRNDKCSTFMSIPGASRGTRGYNVLTGEFMDHVLDPAYFGGQCEYVYNGDWREKLIYDSFCESINYNEDEKNYRKPYNYHTYQFVAQASSEGSHEYYDDMVNLLNARKSSKSSNAGFTVGIYYLQGGLSGGRESSFLTNLTKHNNKDLGFVRLYSKVQTAHFKMRSDKLMLHDDMLVSLMELPEEYNFGMYTKFFNTFGTHYVTEGTMGGNLEYVVVVNKTVMAQSEISGKDVGRCFGGSIGIANPMGSYLQADLSLSGQRCKKSGEYSEDRSSSSVSVDDIITRVNGGIVDSSSGLLAIRNPETYRKWGATLKYNPSLIDYEIMPIYELVRLSTAADHVGARLANMQRAWEEYLQKFNSCRCGPCMNNGIPVLTGTSCSCICKSGYEGLACEETLRRDARTDGSWSCWGPWSPCASGRKTRTRVCNNPPPDAGGVTCLGTSSQTHYC